jgi:hypothetical protein
LLLKKYIFGSTTKKATREWNVQILVASHVDNLRELAMHKLAYNIKIALKETYFEGLDWILPVQDKMKWWGAFTRAFH